MVRLMVLIVSLWLTACSGDPSPVQAPSGQPTRPTRIVSLDYCADQYVLKLADRTQILAISPDAVEDFSYMREKAVGIPTVRPVAEDVLTLKPDLVVRAYGGGANSVAFFKRAGVPVLQVGWAATVDGEELGAIPTIIQHMAEGMGQAERGQALVQDFRAGMNALHARGTGEAALYMTPAFFETLTNHPTAWSPTNHPVARAQLEGPHVVPLQGAWTACGGWFILDAIEALTEGRAE